MSAFDSRILLVCGAEKCGTTSLFSYLSAHPDVCASSKKETDFFRSDASGLDDYASFFAARTASDSLCVESSPAYMAEALEVAPRIAKLLPHARCLFILRDPVDRLRSCFRFYKSRLHLPQDMSFEQFAQVCLAYEASADRRAVQGLRIWHLNCMSRGRYEAQLSHFSRCLPEAQLMTLLYDELRDDLPGLMHRVCAFAGLDPVFYEQHPFARENVSFMAQHRTLQRAAILVNDKFEGIWRRNPNLKRKLMGLYKRLNERPLDRDELSPATERSLRDWYGPTYALLSRLRTTNQRRERAAMLSAA